MTIPGEALAWVEVLGWSLLHFVWQGLLVGLLFAVARNLIAREHSSLRYAVGLLSLAVLALSPLLTLWVMRPQHEILASSIGTSVTTAEPVAAMMTALESDAGLSELLPVLVLVWVLGVIVMIGRAVHQWRALDHIATQLAYRQTDMEALLLRVADRFGGMHGTRVLVSRFIDTPTLIGWFKPVILLPAAVVIGFPRQQLELILAHELGHLRRLDHLVNLAQAVVETLLFYHPVVHWISREVRHEREICCDNLVLSLTDSEPSEYARTLAALEDVRQVSPQLAVAASGGMLLDRVRRIVGASRPRKGSRSSLAVVWGVVAGCAIAIFAAIMVPPTDTAASADVFDQPTPFRVSLAPVGIAFSPSEQAMEFAAIRAPVSIAPILQEQPSADVVGEARTTRTPPAPVDVLVSLPVLTPAIPAGEHIGAEPLALPGIADLEPKSPGVDPTPAAVASNAPVLLHQVPPDYPDNGRSGSYAKVGFEFSIDRGGRVRNIRSVSGDVQGAFAVAARNALRQWKFDPKSVSDKSGKSFRQDFEFVSASRALGEEDSDGCITPTGSHLCRPGRGTGLAFKAEERAAATSRTDDIDALDSEIDGACVVQTGSRVCRPYDAGSIAMNAEPRVETSAHTIVLGGGTL
ncbi:M56 family metallopeptidase [Dokdonella sp.]|uniref:M56 family metallopeptidase n=1 Tax=Dokdonella sp. TaxID=2291710 RepID=UPI003C587DA9